VARAREFEIETRSSKSVEVIAGQFYFYFKAVLHDSRSLYKRGVIIDSRLLKSQSLPE
jgi:hypothetical protein